MAHFSVKTAQKYLSQLVEDSVLRTIERDDQTLYCVDRLVASHREIATFQGEHDCEELTTALASMGETVTKWAETYDVETPGELRGRSPASTMPPRSSGGVRPPASGSTSPTACRSFGRRSTSTAGPSSETPSPLETDVVGRDDRRVGV